MRSGELDRLSGQVEAALDAIQQAGDEEAIARAETLARAVMELYAAGLGRVVELASEASLLRVLADDDFVGGLLLLHDLHPDDVDTRIQRALDRVRPYLGSHAGGVEYVGVDAEGVAHLRLEGSCDGCPSSAATVSLTVEHAVLEAAPEVVSVDVTGMVHDPQPPVFQIGLRPGLEHGPDPTEPAGQDWVLLDVPGEVGALMTEVRGGVRLVVANVAGVVYAYLDRCAQCGGSFASAVPAGDMLDCPGCGARFDLHLAGRGVGASGHLVPVPVLPSDDGWVAATPSRVPA